MNSLGIASFPLYGGEWEVRALGAIRAVERNQTITVYLALRGEAVCGEADFVEARAPLGLLPALRIGSVWRDRHLQAEPRWPRDQIHVVSGLQGTGELFYDVRKHADFFARRWPLPQDVRDRGNFVEIEGSREVAPGRHLPCRVLFPCPVILGQFYAATSRLAILLGREPVPGQKWERRFWLEEMPPVKEGTQPEQRSRFDKDAGHLHVCLSSLVEDASFRHVAWLFHEKQARQEAKYFSGWLAVSPGSALEGKHPRIRLPFASAATLEIRGLWDPDENLLLVHRVTRCDYTLQEVKTLTFDRENDARIVLRAPPGTVPPADPGGTGGRPPKEPPETIDRPEVTGDPPLGGQQPLEWEVHDPVVLFGGLGEKEKKKKMRGPPKTPTPPLSDEEVHNLLGCGEGAYTEAAKAPVNLGPASPDSETRRQTLARLDEAATSLGFDFIVAVLRLLVGRNWLVEPV